MKLSYATSLLLLLGIASAAPSVLEKRVPPNTPISLKNGPDPQDSFKCGTHTYTGHQIYSSAQRGVNLQIVGETRGRNKYPHSFENDDSKGNKLAFPNGCPADKKRQEFPLMSPPYDGGKNNVKHGDERVVYYWINGDTDVKGQPDVVYCGIMTHIGAPTGGYLLC